MRRAFLAAILLLPCQVCQAQFAPSNPVPAFTVLPNSTMGTVVNPNALTLTPLPNGFVVSGTLQITIPPGPVSGILAHWAVERRIDPTFSGTGIQTSTVLTGFSLPPPGTFANTNGTVTSTWNMLPSNAVVGGSTSTVPMSLVNGVDVPAWNALTANSGPFVWTAGFFPGVLRQEFTLFGNYTGGAGGTWFVDVPVWTYVVPEPSSVALGAIAFGGFVAFCVRRRRCKTG